jgi:hypothetical protein
MRYISTNTPCALERNLHFVIVGWYALETYIRYSRLIVTNFYIFNDFSDDLIYKFCEKCINIIDYNYELAYFSCVFTRLWFFLFLYDLLLCSQRFWFIVSSWYIDSFEAWNNLLNSFLKLSSLKYTMADIA